LTLTKAGPKTVLQKDVVGTMEIIRRIKGLSLDAKEEDRNYWADKANEGKGERGEGSNRGRGLYQDEREPNSEALGDWMLGRK